MLDKIDGLPSPAQPQLDVWHLASLKDGQVAQAALRASSSSVDAISSKDNSSIMVLLRSHLQIQL